jgi:hypothetical protein
LLRGGDADVNATIGGILALGSPVRPLPRGAFPKFCVDPVQDMLQAPELLAFLRFRTFGKQITGHAD